MKSIPISIVFVNKTATDLPMYTRPEYYSGSINYSENDHESISIRPISMVADDDNFDADAVNMDVVSHTFTQEEIRQHRSRPDVGDHNQRYHNGEEPDDDVLPLEGRSTWRSVGHVIRGDHS